METKELNIQVPEGYEIDKEKSTFEKIIFKRKIEKWKDDKTSMLEGFFIGLGGDIILQSKTYNTKANYNVFATDKQAKSALATARISQIIANDKRFGGFITDDEWNNPIINKYCIERRGNKISKTSYIGAYSFIAFHTEEQCDLFFEENEDLIKDYFML